MSDINVIITKIIKDAEARKEEMLQAASIEEEKIIGRKITQAEEESQKRIEKAKSEAKLKKERIISSAHLEARNRKLSAKQVLISRVFDEAKKSLKSMPRDRYLEFMKRSILSLDLKGDEKLIISKDDADKINGDFLLQINDSLRAVGRLGNLTVSEYYRSFNGGFIVEKGGVEINYTFEALLEAVRDELEYEVANVLFS